jgi:GR25 family glycosyltransferase involved in LPS biosynthesis
MSAVDANTFDATTHPAVSVGTAQNIKNGSRRSHYEIDKAGAVGCSLSHFKAWSVAAGAGPVVIFEDDTHIPTDFIQRLSTVLADLPSHWDIVQFYNTRYEYGLKGCQPDPTGGPLSRCENIMGAFAYMISPEGARKMLRDAYPIELHVDAYMAYMARLGRVTVLWHPLIDILPTLGESTIEHGGGDILNVPTNMKRYGIVMMEKSTLASLMAGALLMGAFLAWGHRAGRKV